MLEIIILIFLSREIGRLALQKGLKPGRWKLILILGWIGLELLGVVVGLVIFGPDNFVSIALLGLAFAVTSYFIVKANLSNRPDIDLDDDINRLGQ